jgi:hypothetical protein
MARQQVLRVRSVRARQASIAGSFRAILKADGESIARRAFVQSAQPRTCDTCRQNPVINLGFLVEADRIRGAELPAGIELVSRDDPRAGDRVPLYAWGDPTINVRMLLQESD